MTAVNTPDIGHGTVIRVGTNPAAISATVTLGRVRSITPPPFSRDTVDVTSMESAGMVREFIPALIDRGEMTVEILWVPGDPTDDAILAMQAEREPRLIEISLPQINTPAPTCTFRALLTGYEQTVELEAELSATITLKVTGNLTWTNV